MIGYHLKDSLHWLHLLCFKLHTFGHEAKELSRAQTVAVILKVYPWLFLFGVILFAAIGFVCNWMGIPFDLLPALSKAVKNGLLFSLLGGLIGGGLANRLDVGLALVLANGLFFGLGSGLAIEIHNALVPGVVFGLLLGLLAGLTLNLFQGLTLGLVGGLAGGFVFGLSEGQNEAMHFATAYFPVFLATYVLAFGRIYYWPFHLFQFWRARRSQDWLTYFRHSPVHWDETIGLPLPWLVNWLFEIAKNDRKAGMEEVKWVIAERSLQGGAARKALLNVALHDMRELKSMAQLAEAAKKMEVAMKLFPIGSDLDAEAIKVIGEYLDQIQTLAKDYLLRHTPHGQHKALFDLQGKLQSIREAMLRLPKPIKHEFKQVAMQWAETVNVAEAELRARLPMENPFKVGNALLEYEEDLFKGRRDLIVKLEEAIFANRLSLLLYGRRRTGKTSTLLNLPRLMSSQFVPVFIDCQNARWSDSDAMFCYHLTRALYAELAKRKLAEGLVEPQKSEYEQYAFTRLDEFLDELEAHSRRIGKQILLTFDEYERLEEGIRDGKLTCAVLNQIRAIVQHRQQLIVLFSGSHRFEEMQVVNWSDYLINVQTLHLSFLSREEARELIEHPTPEFALGYEPGVVDRMLDLTHSQPYLVQALGSELVSLINKDKRKQATMADLDTATERVLAMADAYFENNWRDCNEREQSLLSSLASQQADDLTPAERQNALLGLSRKELIEQPDGQWQFTIELFSQWIRREKTAEMLAISSANQQPNNDLLSAFHAQAATKNFGRIPVPPVLGN